MRFTSMRLTCYNCLSRGAMYGKLYHFNTAHTNPFGSLRLTIRLPTYNAVGHDRLARMMSICKILNHVCRALGDSHYTSELYRC